MVRRYDAMNGHADVYLIAAPLNTEYLIVVPGTFTSASICFLGEFFTQCSSFYVKVTAGWS